jgi:hypothetical protein
MDAEIMDAVSKDAWIYQAMQKTYESQDGPKTAGGPAVLQFGLRVGPGKREIPSASLRAGSSLRLKKGSAQDDPE